MVAYSKIVVELLLSFIVIELELSELLEYVVGLLGICFALSCRTTLVGTLSC